MSDTLVLKNRLGEKEKGERMDVKRKNGKAVQEDMFMAILFSKPVRCVITNTQNN